MWTAGRVKEGESEGMGRRVKQRQEWVTAAPKIIKQVSVTYFML